MACNEAEHWGNMQTAIITGSSVPDRASAGSQLSSQNGDNFAQYFELAEQKSPLDENLALREQQSDTLAEGAESELPTDGEPESGLDQGTESVLPTNIVIAKEGGNSTHAAGDSSNESKGKPPTELPQAVGRPSLHSQSQGATEDGKTRVNGQENGQSASSADAPSLNGKEHSRAQRGRVGIGDVNAQGQVAQPENRAAASRLPYYSGSFPASTASAGGSSDTASKGKIDVSEARQIELEPGVAPLRHPARANPEEAGLSAKSDRPSHPITSLQQGVSKANLPLDTSLLDGTLHADKKMPGNPGRPAFSPDSEFPGTGTATILSSPPATTANQARRTPGGIVETAAVQKAVNQQMADPEIDPADSFMLPHTKSVVQTASTQSYEAMLTRPETARMVAAQMVNAMISAQSNKVGIALNPEELGRVRMVLSTTETGVLISIAAERPETLDLMRRHIDQLAEEFRNLGYTDIGFEFAEGDARGHFNNESTDNPHEGLMQSTSISDASDPDPLPPTHALLSCGLDLRL